MLSEFGSHEGHALRRGYYKLHQKLEHARRRPHLQNACVEVTAMGKLMLEKKGGDERGTFPKRSS